MLLVIDAGNTSITFGLYNGKRLVRTWRCGTKKTGLAPYFIRHLPKARIEGVCIASVVPEIDRSLRSAVKERYGLTPLFVTHKNAGIKIAYKKPHEIGADRLADAVAAWTRYKRACIVVDIGTATTVEYIDEKGRYMGGPITFGLATASDALYQATSKLPRVRLVPMRRMIPKSTEMAIMTGTYVGYLGLIERLVYEMKREVGGRPLVILTGGLSSVIGKDVGYKKEPLLTLEGLHIIWKKNRP